MNTLFKRVRIKSICVLSASVFSLNNKQPGRKRTDRAISVEPLENIYRDGGRGGGDGFD